ncbi:hypothetical protein DTO027B5_5190 [Paecilomyces variotii]|nr:hypothetical protein DTO195F2_1812 [Paecilomyces variotii]KAJ9307916.1 hypothetical protein DTO217A2_2672 [Paecilomyces variotii]KAJ9320194.1 hypothetical protein DTO027B3_8790 [Paecilomyces variotii]KAJ9333102.1 hypothetical protein DTO027B5_5190 [Paecilomyces variotii]KAJ9351543.1 hypothetical protein DTO027B9_6344 [Paecilomyces variotii]
MKLITYVAVIFMAPQLLTALPTLQPRTVDTPTLRIRDIPSSEVDLPAFITAVFDGIANVIAASGGAAANTIAATGGAVANGLGTDGTESSSSTPASTNTTLVGRALGEKVGRAVAQELTDALAGKKMA